MSKVSGISVALQALHQTEISSDLGAFYWLLLFTHGLRMAGLCFVAIAVFFFIFVFNSIGDKVCPWWFSQCYIAVKRMVSHGEHRILIKGSI